MRRVVVPLGLFLALGLLAGPAAAVPPRATPEALAAYRAAHEALARGEFDEAAAGFDGLGQDPLLGDYAQFFLAETRLRAGAEAPALEGFLDLPRRFPSSTLVPPALLAAGDLAFRLERFDAAAEAYRRFLARAPNHPEAGRALVRLAVARARQGAVSEAIADLRRRWLETPTSEWGQVAREWMETLALERGLALRSLTVEERDLLARGLAEGGEVGAAVQLWEGLLPELQEPALRHRLLLRLAPALSRLGRGDEAIDRLRVAAAESPTAWTPRLLFELARLLVRSGQGPEAVTVLERLLASHPESPPAPEALLLLARLQEERGRPSAALATLGRLTARHPDTPQAVQARWQIGWLHYRARRYGDAAAAFRQLAADSPSYRPAALYWAGRSLDARREASAARKAYRELLRLAPRSYYGLLAARRVKGQPPAPAAGPVRVAAEPLRLLEGDLNFAKGRVLWSLGFEAHALAELDAVLMRASAEPDLLYGLSLFYDELGEVGRSLRLLRRHFGAAAEAAAPGLPVPFWRLFYPLGYAETVRAAAARSGLDPLFVAAVIREESSYDPRARSWVGAIGLMQLMPETARKVAREAGLPLPDGGLWEPSVNIPLGVSYLARLKGRFGQPLLAAAGYNAGPHRVERWWAGRRTDDIEEFVEAIPFDETRGFVKRVLASWWNYRRVYGGGPAPSEAAAMPPGGE